jgi:hypothetical protein
VCALTARAEAQAAKGSDEDPEAVGLAAEAEVKKVSDSVVIAVGVLFIPTGLSDQLLLGLPLLPNACRVLVCKPPALFQVLPPMFV